MAKASVLVIDDEQSFLDVITNKLKNFDYKVLQALNGEMGILVTERYLPDVIICDWEMPILNGIETIKKLKKEAKTQDIPIIMATGGMTSSEHLETALNAGAIDYIRKPIDPIELIARINSALKLSKSYKEIKLKNEKILLQASNLEKANKELEKFSLALSKTENAIIITDTDGKIEWVNTGFYNLYQTRESVGSNFFDIKKSPSFSKSFHNCISSKTPELNESEINIDNEKQIHTQISITPIINNQLVEKLVIIETDISQIKKLESFKNSMINMIVHDMRNPIITITGFVDLIKDNEYYNYIKSAGFQLHNLVENILDVQKYKNTEIQLNKKPHLIKPLIKKAIDEVLVIKLASIPIDELNIEFNISEHHEATFDYDIIKRVIVNLVTNAVKYTELGKKVLITSDELTRNGKNYLKISVIDSGKGIPENVLPMIFDEFFQANDKKYGISGSTGIGLTYCKRVIEAHGGEIGVLSEIKKGSTFWFLLPVNL